MAFSDVQTGLDAVRLARIAQNLTALEADLDFVIKLTAAQRSKMYSIGNSRFSFVEKALRFAKQFPNLLPGFRNLTNFVRISHDYSSLLPVFDRVKTLYEKLDDTVMQIGGNYIDYSLTFYDNAKAARDGDEPGTEVICKELGSHFVRKNGKEVLAEEPETETETGNENGKTNGGNIQVLIPGNEQQNS